MAKNASPRMADMQHVRIARDGSYRLIVGMINEGPRSELGKTVHVTVDKSDLPALKLLVQDLEKGNPYTGSLIAVHDTEGK